MTWPGPGPWPPGATAVIAHRGGPAPGVRENSLAAFAAAVDAGADLVELDVRRTGDGQLVVHHDADVGGVPVAQASLADLRAAGDGPDLLADVIALLAGRIGLDVELKEPGYEAEVLAALAPAVAAEPPLIVTSFVDGALTAAREAAPAVATGLLVAGTRRLDRRLAATGAALALPERRFDTPRLRARAAARGLPLVPWTVNNPRALANRLRDPRVAGVITDRPVRALDLRARLA
jgi:glycerophosphoryl diester phosphodiesterase